MTHAEIKINSPAQLTSAISRFNSFKAMMQIMRLVYDGEESNTPDPFSVSLTTPRGIATYQVCETIAGGAVLERIESGEKSDQPVFTYYAVRPLRLHKWEISRLLVTGDGSAKRHRMALRAASRYILSG
jgi:hypothetical protein